MGRKRIGSDLPPPNPDQVASFDKTVRIELAREVAKLNVINQYTPFGNCLFPDKRTEQSIFRALVLPERIPEPPTMCPSPSRHTRRR